jgi:predicted amidohydrolase YtcJ
VRVAYVLPIALCLAPFASQPITPAGPPADLILHHARIYTLSESHPVAEALAVGKGRFVAVGTRADVLRWKGRSTEMIDAGSATVVPGLQDAHGHVLSLGKPLRELDLRDTPTFEAIVERVRARAATMGPGEWVLGRGWDQNRWPVKEWPAAGPLDIAAPKNPVFLTRIDGHAALASRLALEAGDVGRETPDPAGGRIVRDAAGTPTGVLVDRAQALVARHIPTPSRDQLIEQLVLADRDMRRVGLTMVHDAGVEPAVVELYRELVAAGRIGTRVYVMLTGLDVGDWFRRGPVVDPHHRLTVRAIKLVADGALGSRGAALLEDYADEPGVRGLPVTPPDRLYVAARAASAAGFQTAVHAIGDRANREVLDMFERIERELPAARGLRPRVEHAQILDRADIPRFARLGVIASVQTTHCTSDMPWAPRRLGEARVAEGAYVWRKLIDAGALLAQGSDFPVERPDPLLGFYAAITRQDTNGQPLNGWAADQRLTREEALRAMTLGAAYAAHAEHDLGSIEPGKLADFVVLSRDIMQVEPRDVLSTAIVRTVVDGRTVYRQ